MRGKRSGARRLRHLLLSMVPVVSIAFLFLFLSNSGRALGQEATPAPSPTPSSQSTLLDNLSDDFLPIFALVLLVALTWSVLLFYDLLKSYKVRQLMWKDLLGRIDKTLSAKEVVQ